MYQNSPTESEYTLAGNVLHTDWSYSPVVTDLSGESTVYVYDKKDKVWIEKEGQVSYVYVPGYGETPVVNFFRGYMDFGGDTPSTENFVHGVAYQWAYLYLPETATLSGTNTQYAVWDEKVGAWLVGFSIYLWDKEVQDYNTYLEKVTVPANGYPTNTMSTNVLMNGVDYKLFASGTANAGDYIEFDAKYSRRSVSSTEWTDAVSTYEYLGPQLLDLYVNNQNLDWGAYNENHEYTLTVVGSGSQIGFRIYDTYPSNNVGELTVDIYGMYIPFAFAEPVPASDYNPLEL